MKKIGFLNLSINDIILLKSIILLLDRKKDFIIIENCKPEEEDVKIFFVNNGEPKEKELLQKNSSSALVVISQNAVSEQPNSLIYNLENPFKVQKVFALLNRIQNDQLGVKNKSIDFSIENALNMKEPFLISDNLNYCLVIKDSEEIYHNFEKEDLNNWVQQKNLNIQVLSCEKSEVIKRYGLNSMFVYESLYYILHFNNIGKNTHINEHTILRLKKFPNFFPQINIYRETYKDFYQVCFYLSKKDRSIKEVSINLNISLEFILKCTNALHKMNFLTIVENKGKIETGNSQVRSIFARIKNTLGIK